MGIPEGGKSFKIGLAVLIQYRHVTDSYPASRVAVASTRYAYLRRAVKMYKDIMSYITELKQKKKSKGGITEEQTDVKLHCP